MLFASFVFFLLLSQQVFAVDLNIYTTVTEARQAQSGIGQYRQSFTNDQYSNIIDGSISWDGTPFLKLELSQSINFLKGATVTVRRSNQCECENICAKIVDPNTLLLENSQTGVQFYADRLAIDYTTEKPSNGGETLLIDFGNKNTKYSGILSYLTRGITWKPYYELFYSDDNPCSLKAYASISNNQQQQYEVDNSVLYSSDLQLANTFNPILSRGEGLKGGASTDASAFVIQPTGEQKGFYSYSIKSKYILRPLSSIYLPFLNVNPQCRFYYKTTTSVSPGIYKGVFQRNYDLTPDKFLPGGIITIRDNHVLVGQANLPDVPNNYTQTITLGNDYDIRYETKGNLTASSESDAKITWHTYLLDVKISNYKDKEVKGVLAFYGAPQTTIDKTTCNSATVDATLINLPFTLAANGNIQCQMTVTLRWG